MNATSYLQNATEDQLAAAVEDNEISFWKCMSALPRCSWNDDGRLIWFSTGIPWTNRVMRANLSARDIDQQIESIIAYFRGTKLPFVWIYGPGSVPPDLGRHLEEHGLIPSTDHPMRGMAVALETVSDVLTIPPGLVIKEVRDDVTLRDYWAPAFSKGMETMTEPFVQAAVNAFAAMGLGPESAWQHFIGWLADKPVATATLHYGAGVAGIYGVSAVREVRRRGIGTAITSAALLLAKSRGYKYAVLTASKMSANVYPSLGFRQYCSVGRYSWTPES